MIDNRYINEELHCMEHPVNFVDPLPSQIPEDGYGDVLAVLRPPFCGS